MFEASATESLDTYGDKYTMVCNHAQWLGLGLIVLAVAQAIPTKYYQEFSPLIYFVGLIGLIAVLIPNFGVTVNGATRWLAIGSFRFQPAELMKLGIVLFFPRWLIQHQRPGAFLLTTLLPLILVMMQPDLGSTLIIATLAFGLYALTERDLRTIGGFLLGGMALITLLIIVSPYRRERIRTFINPDHDNTGESYHIQQITLALGNGGLMGVGPGQSMQKYRYIPELSTDSIFALIAEEFGFIGSLLVIALMIWLIQTSFAITMTQKPDSYSFLLSAGISLWLAAQTILNLAAIVSLVPLTGIPLPLISRGGTSLVVLLFLIGVLLSIGEKEKLLRNLSKK